MNTLTATDSIPLGTTASRSSTIANRAAHSVVFLGAGNQLNSDTNWLRDLERLYCVRFPFVDHRTQTMIHKKNSLTDLFSLKT